MSPTQDPAAPQAFPQAVFFDRDGVLNHDTGYVFRVEDFHWRESAIETVGWLNAGGAKVFVVTNQSGVARGFYAEADVEALHAHMQRTLGQAGAHIDGFRFCPHHPEGVVEPFRVDCGCRKPRSGMIEDFVAQWGLDPALCVMFGDRESDMEAARGAGVRGVWVTDDRLLIEVVREACRRVGGVADAP